MFSNIYEKIRTFADQHHWILGIVSLFIAISLFVSFTDNFIQVNKPNGGTIQCYSGGILILDERFSVSPRFSSHTIFVTVEQASGKSISVNADCVITYH